MVNNAEDIVEMQRDVVAARKKYSKGISRQYNQNNKAELDLLKNQKYILPSHPEKPKDFTLEDDLIDKLNTEILDKDRINVSMNELKNLHALTIIKNNLQNCDLYKELQKDDI